MRDFRKTKLDRTSIAINAATATPSSSPVANPTTGNITTGTPVTVTWTEATQTATQRIGRRAQYAVPTAVITAGHYLENWSVSNGVLSVTLNAGSVGDAVSFWVF